MKNFLRAVGQLIGFVAILGALAFVVYITTYFATPIAVANIDTHQCVKASRGLWSVDCSQIKDWPQGSYAVLDTVEPADPRAPVVKRPKPPREHAL